MKSLLLIASLSILTNIGFAQVSNPAIAPRVTAEPKAVLVEDSGSSRTVNVDFRIENPGDVPMKLAKIELSVFDKQGGLEMRKFMTAAGIKHGSFDIVSVPPKATVFIFNPFDSFDSMIELASLRYDFTFETEDGSRNSISTVNVLPTVFVPMTALSLPLKGRILVHDGHDTFAHHRRFNLAEPFLKELGVDHNFTRYASDLCIVNEKGELRRNQSKDNTDWYGFGAIVYAPGAGRVVRARGNVPDNIDGKATFTLDDFRKDPTTPAGNYVVIDHLDGEFSLMAHLKQGSLLVKEGDTVRTGQPIAQMGVSGDANLPHVHYELRTAAVINAEGLPAYFSDYVRILGTRRISIKRAPINSGDLIQNR